MRSAKNIRPVPSDELYLKKWTANYDQQNYTSPLQKYVMVQGHKLLEKSFSLGDHFGTVLELGAGTGEHIQYVLHGFDRYIVSDISELMLDQGRARLYPEAMRARIQFAIEDAAKLSQADNSVDRLIACHILEHVLEPEKVLLEWSRVVKPGGVLSILLPCDPGILWRFGRCLGPRRNFEKLGLPYDYWMAREHVNSVVNLMALIRYYFPSVKEGWWPARMANVDVNLFYGCNIYI